MDIVKLNNQITAPELRVVGESGENLGVMSLAEAKTAAEIKGKDLILIVPNSNPPVARIMSYDKFRYIKEKELKKQRTAQKAPEMKTIQISPREAKNDLLIKLGKIKNFLADKHKIEVKLRLRGREKAMKDWARTKMEDFKKLMDFPHRLSQNIQFDGKQFTIRIDPV